MSSISAKQGQDPSTAYAMWIRIGGFSALLSALAVSSAAMLNISKAAFTSTTGEYSPLNFYTSLLDGSLNGWPAIAGVAFLLLASVGISLYLNSPGRPVWIAFLSVVAGSLFLLLGYLFSLFAVRQLEPQLAGGIAEARTAVLAMAGTVNTTSSLMLVVGSGFTFGLGVGLFGLFGLQSERVPAWVGWLGILAGLLHIGWLDTLAPPPLSSILTAVKQIDLLLFLTWLAIMGVILLRRRTD